MFHCSYVTLQRYLEGDLGRLTMFFCRRHITHCPACACALEQIRHENEEQKKFCDSLLRETENQKEITRILTSGMDRK